MDLSVLAFQPTQPHFHISVPNLNFSGLDSSAFAGS